MQECQTKQINNVNETTLYCQIKEAAYNHQFIKR